MDHGAHFYRCDFQVHSPRDQGWVGTDCVAEQDRKAYATSLIQACRQKGLQAIAITDHHDLLFAKYIRDAARAERDGEGHPLPADQQIVVFPGMELTLNVPCQAILLFDADFPDDLFSLVLTALAITPSKDAEAKTVETKRLDHITILEMLRSELDKHAYLRNRYIILPVRSFKGIICDDISEFESHMPSQAVGSPSVVIRAAPGPNIVPLPSQRSSGDGFQSGTI
jgi:chromosome segregation protein